MRPCGGDEEVRTPDPLRARQVLSQLSYTPKLPAAFEDACDIFKIEQHLTHFRQTFHDEYSSC